MSNANLLAAAALRRTAVVVGDESVTVREPGYLEMAAFREKLNTGDDRAAFAVLLAACVINEDGTPRLTADEAAALANGRRAVFVPLIEAITDLSAVKVTAKNA